MKEKVSQSKYGMVAQFADGEALLKAAHKVREAGYTATDGYSPIPVHGLIEALGIRRSRIASVVFVGGSIGALTGFSLQYWVSVIAFPHVVSGRPLFSWPSFVPVIFEFTVLFSAFSAVFGMFGLNGLPRPHHPVFSAPEFERATTDGFFLSIEAQDPKYDSQATRALLESTGASRVTEISNHPDDTK